MDQGARNRRALLFAAAELVHKMSGARLHRDEFEQLMRARLAFRESDALEQKGKSDVFQHAHRREQIEELKDKAEPVASIVGQCSVVRLLQRKAIDFDFASRRCFQSSEQMHQGALATAARATDRHELAARDLERNVIDRMHGALATLIITRDIAERDQACLIH